MSPIERDEHDPYAQPDVPIPRSRRPDIRMKESEVDPSCRPADEHRHDDYYEHHQRQANRPDNWPQSPPRDFAPLLIN